MISKGTPPCHRKGLVHSTMFDLFILLTSSHENVVNRRCAAWPFKGVCMILGSNRGKRMLAAELTKFPSILRFRGLSLEVSVEVSSYHKNIPDGKMCEDGVQGGPNLSSTIVWFCPC